MRLSLLTVGAIVGATWVMAPHAAAEPTAPPNPLFHLVDTAAARLQTAEQVAATKWVKGELIEDPKRVVQVLDSVDADASSHGLDQAYIRRVFTDQINATEAIEYARFSQWKMDPASAPTHAPDLSESRRAIDGFDQTMVADLRGRSGGPARPELRDHTERRARRGDRGPRIWTRCTSKL